MKKGYIIERDVRKLIYAHRQEENNIEYKQELVWNSNFIKDLKEYEWKKNNIDRFKILKTILAFSNTEGGGFLVLGVEETSNGQCLLKGMSERYWDTFPDTRDEVLAKINTHCKEPHYASFDYYKGIIDGCRVVVFRIHESLFEPVVSKGNHPKVKAGVIYCRSGRIPESSPANPKLLRKIKRRFRRNRHNLQFLNFLKNYIVDYELDGGDEEVKKKVKGITLFTKKGNVEDKIYIELQNKDK